MFEPDLLRTFLAVCETLSFSEAARRLELSQPTISQRIRQLEQQTGRQLLIRDTRGVALSDSGEAMLAHARRIVRAIDDARLDFSRTEFVGRIRFGSADDLAFTQLPGILRSFRRRHPGVLLELSVNQSATLVRRLRAGMLDLIYVRREAGMTDGTTVRRDQLIWGAHRTLHLLDDEPVPLVTYQSPSPSRSTALRTLAAAARAWQISCSARDISGILAGVRAGLGVSPFPLSMMPPDLVAADSAARLPNLGSVEFALLDNPNAPPALVDALRAAVIGRNLSWQ